MIFTERHFHPAVPEESYKRFLRLPRHHPLEPPLVENMRWAREWFAAHGRPWLCAVEIPLEVWPESGLRLGGTLVGTGAIAARFAGATAAAVVAASAGPEAEAEATARWEAGEPDRYFFLDSYAAAVVEALLIEAGRRLKAWAGERTVLPYYCPGYRGWPITDTAPVLAALAAAGTLPGALATLDSGMLCPKKSQLALFGVKPALELECR